MVTCIAIFVTLNITVKKSGAGAFEFMLIGFDWTGEAGVARYPFFANRREVDRPEGATDGGPIPAEHDRWMLEAIIREKGRGV